MPAATQLQDGTWDYGDRIYDPNTKKFTPKGQVSGPAGQTDFKATATDDPRMVQAYQDLLARKGADVTKRAIDRSTLGVMDAAALGGSDAKALMSSRGVLGTGAGAAYVNKNITQPAIREAAGKAADISLGRERDLDALTLAQQGAAGGIAGNNLTQRQFGLETWQAQQADAARRAQMEMEQRNQELAQMMAITQMMGTFSDTFPGGISNSPSSGGYGPRVGSIGGI